MEFVCLDPNAMVRAANVRATLDAFRLAPSLGHQIIARHRLALEDLTPDKFIPLQRWLDALKEIQAEVGAGVVRQVGVHVIRNAAFPPSFTTVEAVLESLDNIYYLNHVGNVGHYYSASRADGTIVVRCETPYPRRFEQGLIEGICNKMNGSIPYVVEYEDGPAGTDVSCVITVSRRAPEVLKLGRVGFSR